MHHRPWLQQRQRQQQQSSAGDSRPPLITEYASMDSRLG